MNFLPRAMVGIVLTTVTAAVAGPSFAQTCACAPEGGASQGSYAIQADQPPPPLPEYDQPPIPAPGDYWTPGYWAWNNDDYYWVPGAWVEPPQPGLLWTPGYWAFVGGVYAFRPGYWGPHVGYYGGIDYGYGYAGSGYQGGRWDNGQFFYNTTVNNLGAARIANVYNEPIARNGPVSRASFNGGPGGVVATPTAAQTLADKEPHVAPTAAQRNHARLASVDRTQFVSTNQGKPAIAATQRPGEFKGKGSIPAKAAGKAALATPAETPAPAQTPAPAGNAEPKRKQNPPTAERPPAGAERPPAAAERKPETPAAGDKKPPATAERPPAAAERTQERPPAAVERPPAGAERPPAAAQRAVEHPPAQAERRPAQPERGPEARECGRPGLPPCPK